MRLPVFLLVILTLCGCSRIAVLKEVNPVFKLSPEVSVDIDSHTKAFREATKYEKADPSRAGESYLASLQSLSRDLEKNPKSEATRRAYNFALERMFSLIRARNYQSWDAPMVFGRYQFTSKSVPRAGWRPNTFEFLPSDQVQVGGDYLQHMAVRDGLGASLVAIGRTEKTNYKATFSQARTYYGVSAVARFKGNVCEVSFHDPLDEETVTVGSHTYPLAADFTTPLAVLLTRERPEKLGLVRLLDPDKYAETARLSRLRPYDPDRIPLLLVHGLLDTPATWVPMVNALRADPLIRKKYQIWAYSYPSGYPYPYSAALLRQELDRIKTVYPNHKPIVYVGHSMGGMIGKLMITSTGDSVWEAYFHDKPARIDMSPREKKLMEDMFIFNARPDISRAIFICTPHRGADMAGGWIGRIGRKLVKVPQTMIQIGDALRQIVTLSEGGLAYETLPTSIDTLTPTNSFVRTVDSLPISPRIPYHSIMGDRGQAKAKLHPEEGSDGFVPYKSSHLPGAASELIIPSNHSGHQSPEGIAEVIRILKLHLARGSN
ncbi:MAG: alpha/beta hydrolase [Verrucomicrobiales bacterium]|nr:alpha/beta hydrolase [Verrucomicrobiales bacterium]